MRASYDFAITDNVLARVTGVSTSRDGYQDVIDFTCAFPGSSGDLPTQPINKETGCKIGTQGGADYIGGRGMLRWEASDDFEILLTADYQKETAEPKADTVTHINPGAGARISGILGIAIRRMTRASCPQILPRRTPPTQIRAAD